MVEIGAEQAGDLRTGAQAGSVENPGGAVRDGEVGGRGVGFEETRVGGADETVLGPVRGR